MPNLERLTTNFSSLKSFKTRGGIITDENISLLNRVPLEHLSILNDDPEFEGHNLKELPPLVTMRLMPRNISLVNLLPLLKKSQEVL
jgi:hypothetical protein